MLNEVRKYDYYLKEMILKYQFMNEKNGVLGYNILLYWRFIVEFPFFYGLLLFIFSMHGEINYSYICFYNNNQS
jgi:hypothetical protein